jgi:hypothetical protein
MRQPLHAGEVIDLAAGEAGKQVTIWVVPQGKPFVVECVGVNAFAPPGQKLFATLHVTTAGYVGIYSTILVGSSTIAEPAFPARSFGSQQVRLYADPETNLDFSIARDDATADAQIFLSVSGVLIDTRTKAS